MIDVFISHSSKADAKLAAALANFLRDALSLKKEQIRCTSVDGYRLPAGSHTESQLRKEIKNAKYFLALITPASLKSPWVLIELGARWTTEQPLMPLLAKGVAADALKGPIASLNALRCDQEAQMQQLVGEMAKAFGDSIPQPSVYQKTLNQLVYLAKRQISTSPAAAPTSLDPIEQALLDDRIRQSTKS